MTSYSRSYFILIMDSSSILILKMQRFPFEASNLGAVGIWDILNSMKGKIVSALVVLARFFVLVLLITLVHHVLVCTKSKTSALSLSSAYRRWNSSNMMVRIGCTTRLSFSTVVNGAATLLESMATFQIWSMCTLSWNLLLGAACVMSY